MESLLRSERVRSLAGRIGSGTAPISHLGSSPIKLISQTVTVGGNKYKISNLSIFNLSWTELSGGDLGHLVGMTKLSSLDLINCTGDDIVDVAGKVYENLLGMTHLTELEITYVNNVKEETILEL